MSAIESIVIVGAVHTAQLSHDLLYVQSSLPVGLLWLPVVSL